MPQSEADLVVTYVDNRDPVWTATVSQYNTELSNRRYRDWDTLKYWFRAVEQNMKFVRTVHLVVSGESQVPTWLDRSAVHIVPHKDIIPEELLPTFNSTTIEMYLYRIPGLTERFIYSNDDMFAIRSMDFSDFFSKHGLPKYELVRRDEARNTFRMQCRNSYLLAAKAAGITAGGGYFYIAHSMDPMLKSVCEEIHGKAGHEIFSKCTKFREPWNFTQYLFPIYALMTGRGEEHDMPFRYFIAGEIQAIVNEMEYGKAKTICVNDIGVDFFEKSRDALTAAFETRFPEKSRFEA